MKIKILNNFRYLDTEYKKDTTVEVSDRLGQRWERNGIAKIINESFRQIIKVDNEKPTIGFVTLQHVEKDEVANTRFRVTWALPYMPNSFISEKYEELKQADVVIFQSRFSVADIKLAEKLKADNIPLIWDFTDPHWLKEYDPHAVHPIFYAIDKLADLVTFCTEGLVATYKKVFPKAKTAIVKDRLDLNIYSVRKFHENSKDKEFKILWHGSYGNICSLDLARVELEKLGKEFKLRLICIFDKTNVYSVKPIPNVTIETREWSNGVVISGLLESDISINPKFDGHWKAYKSNNKTVTALACGVPCVERNFYKEIKLLLSDASLRNMIANEGVKLVEKEYDVKLTANEWHKLADSLIKDNKKINNKSKANTVVYTAISGENYHDTLRENQFNDGTADFVAFLDKQQKSNIWTVNKIFRQFIDPSRQAKIYKVLPWQFFNYEYSIWMDGCVSIKVSPRWLIETYLKDADIAMFKHHSRDDIYEEYKADLQYLHRKLEPNYLFKIQMDKYRKEGFPEHSGLNECTIILRRHTEPVKRMCEEWWSEITAYTVADQCSFAYVLRKHGLKVNNIPGTVLDNKFFERSERIYVK